MDADTTFSHQGFIEELQAAFIEYGFSLFGSCVSVGYRRDYHTREYEKKVFEEYSSYEYLDYLKGNMVLFPEHSGRFEIPGDIDCFFREDSIKPVDDFFMKHKQFVVVHKDKTNMYNTIMHNISMLTLIVRPALHSSIGHKLDVKVDIMYGMRDLDPPLTNVDFRCNALIKDKYGYRVSKKLGGIGFFENMELLREILGGYQVSKKLEGMGFFENMELMREILGEVLEKRAVRPLINDYCYDACLDKRTAKMLEKGWVVMDDGCIMVKPCVCICKKGNVHSDSCYKSDVCTICLADLDKDSFQRNCCNTAYHSSCYIKMRSNTGSTCPGCRANMPRMFGRI